MDKTSRGYAEKLAEEKASTNGYDYESPCGNGHEDFVEGAIFGYLTAIEETNAKGKDEVIKIQLDALEAVYPMLLDTHDVAIKVAEAIRKAKEVTNGK